MTDRPGLCAYHHGIFASLDDPNGEGPNLTPTDRDTWAEQLAGQCCSRVQPTTGPREERQP